MRAKLSGPWAASRSSTASTRSADLTSNGVPMGEPVMSVTAASPRHNLPARRGADSVGSEPGIAVHIPEWAPGRRGSVPGRRGRSKDVPKIVMIGAGSAIFTRVLLGDIFSFPELRDAQIALHDID